MAATVVSILHLEDSVLDAELVRDRLERAGLVASLDLVSKKKDFIARLKARTYDVIISDYQVPTFEGLAALELAQEHQPDTPFIFVSGAMGEEFAVETLKRGATDYILKQRLMRLPAAVERALAERREKTERKKAEQEARRANEELRASEERLRKLLADEREHTALLQRVAGASRAVNAVLSGESIARILTEEARAILGARACVTSFTIPETGAQEVRAISVGTGTEPLPAEEPPFDPQLAAAVCRDGRSLRLAERSAQDGGPRRGRLAAPLIGHGGKSVGVVQLLAKVQGDFSSGDEAVLTQLAAIAAVGIENARLYELLREQDRRKDEFLATLAHELRNPLAPVRNGLRILKFGGNAEQLGKVLDMMERQVAHMVRLIDDLMDVSRITRGRVELRKERVDLRTIMDSALEASRPLIDSASHSLTVSMPPRLYLHADPTRMAQVIANLLNNAAKYTPERGHISVTAERDGATVVIRVKDTGLGIPTDMLPRVFDLFTQVGRTLERSQGGLGIGLTLVRSLVEMHGGTVEVESPGPDQGTTFTVRLRLAEEEEPPRSQPEGSSQEPAEGGLRVLVVDDNIDVAESLALLLSISGHQTRTAHTGPDALVCARAFQPDLMFLDIGLPGMDGYAVAERLRALSDLKQPVLVALTGWGSESDRRRSQQAGFDHHLTKPVDAERIQALLEGLLHRSKTRRAAKA